MRVDNRGFNVAKKTFARCLIYQKGKNETPKMRLYSGTIQTADGPGLIALLFAPGAAAQARDADSGKQSHCLSQNNRAAL